MCECAEERRKIDFNGVVDFAKYPYASSGNGKNKNIATLTTMAESSSLLLPLCRRDWIQIHCLAAIFDPFTDTHNNSLLHMPFQRRVVRTRRPLASHEEVV
jgi:hypothetical protein